MEQTNDMFFPSIEYIEVGETFRIHANSWGFFTSWTDTITYYILDGQGQK